MGTVATGTKAPRRIIDPPTISTTLVAQPSRLANGVPIECKIAMNPDSAARLGDCGVSVL